MDSENMSTINTSVVDAVWISNTTDPSVHGNIILRFAALGFLGNVSFRFMLLGFLILHFNFGVNLFSK